MFSNPFQRLVNSLYCREISGSRGDEYEHDCLVCSLVETDTFQRRMMMMMMMSSMRRDYVSEFLPPTGLLFIPQHGETWWNDLDRGNSFVHQSSLASLPAVLCWQSRRKGRRKQGIYPYDVLSIVILLRDHWHAVNSSDMGPTAWLSLRRKACCGFLSPLQIHRPRPGLNPRTLGPMTSTPPRTLSEVVSDGGIKHLLKCWLIWTQVTLVKFYWTTRRYIPEDSHFRRILTLADEVI
jgi:hypothetical protein